MSLKRGTAYLLDFFILLVLGGCCLLAAKYFEGLSPVILAAIWITAAMLVIVVEWTAVRPKSRKRSESSASALVLLSEAQKTLRTWMLTGKTSALLGKNLADPEDGIDLADTEYAALIDEQHAVLNYTAAGWLIEDLSSRNGIAILRFGKEREQPLAPGVPYAVKPGDILFIAGETRIAVR